jgi:V-type H+-transporting ATPase subunit A
MLNRPRLNKRPSLLDLIQKKNISYISSFSSSRSLFEDDVEPRTVPLPRSPPITPQREDVSESPLPPIALNEDRNQEHKELPAANMGPVSSLKMQRWLCADS